MSGSHMMTPILRGLPRGSLEVSRKFRPSPTQSSPTTFHKTLQNLSTITKTCETDPAVFTNNEGCLQQKHNDTLRKRRVAFLLLLNKCGLRAQDFRYHSWKNQTLIQIRECPTCPPIKGKPDNMWKMAIFESGLFSCLRCQTRGRGLTQLMEAFQFKKLTSAAGLDQSSDMPQFLRDLDPYHVMEWNTEEQDSDLESAIVKIHIPPLREEDVSTREQKLANHLSVARYITNKRGISQETLNVYKVGFDFWTFNHNVSYRTGSLFFPQYRCIAEETIVPCKYKIRSFAHGLKAFTQHPINADNALFGLDHDALKQEYLVLTEGEYDAMAVYEGTGGEVKALSLPTGASNISPEILSQLKFFKKKVVLWMDWDDVGRLAVVSIAEQLKQNGIDFEIVEHTEYTENNECKDANDVLVSMRQKSIDPKSEENPFRELLSVWK